MVFAAALMPQDGEAQGFPVTGADELHPYEHIHGAHDDDLIGPRFMCDRYRERRPQACRTPIRGRATASTGC